VRRGEEWVILIDADQTLPEKYLARMAGVVAGLPPVVAFVQAAHDSDHDRPPVQLTGTDPFCPGVTLFQKAMGLEIRVLYEYDLAWRERYGFLPMMGHGVAVRYRAWEALGGIPPLVAEDFGFAFTATCQGMYGVYAGYLRSWESFPKDFDAFLVRGAKFAGGAAEFLRYNSKALLRGQANWIETLDLLLILFRYPLMPLLVINGFLSAYVCAQLWERNLLALHPALPYVFLGMYLLTIFLHLSVTNNAYAALRHWFWATAVHGACLPLFAWRFCKHLRSPMTYERTPKGSDPATPRPLAAGLTVLLGLAALALSWRWWSPFSPMLAAQGVAYVCFPLYKHLDKPTVAGVLSRAAAWLPGMLLILALYTMWQFPWR
jgi:hypothetical protein